MARYPVPFAFSLILAACGGELPDDAPEPIESLATLEQPAICGREDWDDVEHFAEAG